MCFVGRRLLYVENHWIQTWCCWSVSKSWRRKVTAGDTTAKGRQCRRRAGRITQVQLLLLLASDPVATNDITFFRVQQVGHGVDGHAATVPGHRETVVGRVSIIPQGVGKILTNGSVPFRQVQWWRLALSKWRWPSPIVVVVVDGSRM